jgi:hypothetical protein
LTFEGDKRANYGFAKNWEAVVEARLETQESEPTRLSRLRAIYIPPRIATRPDWDAISRTIQGLITGIAFLGAGVIVRSNTEEMRVRGFITAALWLWPICFRSSVSTAWGSR